MPAFSENKIDSALREQTLDLLRGGNAHLQFGAALEGLIPAHWGGAVAGSPHTIWQLLEHLRIAQHDILEFSRNPAHKSPKWPDEYWPAATTPPDEKAWTASIEQFRRDLESFCGMIEDRKHPLLTPIPHAPEGQTLLREALVLADHNSYHLGQIVLLRKILEGQGSK